MNLMDANKNENSNVIQLSSRRNNSIGYEKKLQEFAEQLEMASAEFFDIALHLAVAGKWRSWNDSIPEGAMFNFDEGMLLDTGDDYVTQATELRISMMDLAERIRFQLDHNSKRR